MTFYHLGNIGFIQPYDTLLGILHLLSLFVFSFKLSSIYKLHSNENLNFFISFILIIILISNLMFLISFIEIKLILIRILINITCLLSLIIYYYNYKNFNLFIHSFFKNIFFIPIIIFFLLSLSPVTDADSLDYHVGYGLNIINNGSFSPRYDWFHYMLSGHGEFFNLYSLLIGSPNFIHLIQFSSILVAISCYDYVKKKYNSSFNFFLFLYSTPLLLWFLTANKSQLFCSILFLLCFVLLLDLIKKFDKKIVFLILLFSSYAVVNKFSFIIPSFFLSLIILYFSFKQGKLFVFFSSCIIIFTIIILPLITKNLIFYLDPFPPIFENFKADPDPSILGFKVSVSTDNAGFPKLSGYEFIFLPILLIFNTKISLFTGLLGFGFLFILFAYSFDYKKIENKLLIFFIISCFVTFAFINNFQPRYYLEIYWMIGLLIILNYEKLNKNLMKIFTTILSLEAVVVMIAAIIGICVLSIGSLNPALYKKTMINTAYNYEEIEWIYNFAESDDKILSENIRSNSLFKSPWLSRSKFFHGVGKFSVQTVRESEIDYIVFNYPITSEKFQNFIDKCSVKSDHKYSTFHVKTRNVFSDYRKKKYDLLLIKNICR